MPLTPETLTRHELNGLHVRVVDAANPDLVGIEGRVVAETRGTLSVASADRVRQVPKQGSTFEFALTDEPAEGSESHSEPRRASRDDVEKTSGTASKRGSETAGVRSGQSGPREGVAYVTVDGARLLSRPELRTEKAGDSQWQ
ncbi:MULTISPECIES: ribonuclease P protein component 1 [Halorussus]|uniref:ribonuclease P protein component 1 n=1 Tax=Halorussus TaxID=1070314 RepID=UPI000E21A2DE|nr:MULTISPECIES: ribonuclease P protein component 1 [Halorussus]NHN59773.1 ribonuclease P protein component 1 [Halorussus sp. JP-T4]